MGETNIEWADFTFNPWIGCANVSAGCVFCYARILSDRYGWAEWGKTTPRKEMSANYWKQPAAWNRKAIREGWNPLVFCSSLADVFEDHPQVRPIRPRLWNTIELTPALIWLLLSKRPENILDMVPAAWLHTWPANVWIGTTTENQDEAERRLDILLKVPAPVRFVSAEPLVGPVGLSPWLGPDKISWVIAGGESGKKEEKIRPAFPEWFRTIRDDCAQAQVPFLFKQWGDWAPVAHGPRRGAPTETRPGLETVQRVGKKTAGSLLDGRTHLAWPAAARRDLILAA